MSEAVDPRRVERNSSSAISVDRGQRLGFLGRRWRLPPCHCGHPGGTGPGNQDPRERDQQDLFEHKPINERDRQITGQREPDQDVQDDQYDQEMVECQCEHQGEKTETSGEDDKEPGQAKPQSHAAERHEPAALVPVIPGALESSKDKIYVFQISATMVRCGVP